MASTTSPPHRLNSPLVVGLIGGMGSGKTTVAEVFARRGAVVVSGDLAGHEALRQPGIREQVVGRWGREVLEESGEVSRKKLGALVFGDPAERKALEEMVFPWIKKNLRGQIDAAKVKADAAVILLDAAIMLEAGWNSACDRLVFVEVPREVRLKRLLDQRGWDEKEVAKREQAQMPLDEKRNRADEVLDNSGSPDEVDRQVERLLERWGVEQSRRKKEKGKK
jgi:dephospho-CoA kinase